LKGVGEKKLKDPKKSRDLSATEGKLTGAKGKNPLFKTQDENFFKTTENLVGLQDPAPDGPNFEYMSSDNLKRKNFNYLTTTKKKKQKKELNLTGDLRNSSSLLLPKTYTNNPPLLMPPVSNSKSQNREIDY
jgi:hypothetical protein